MGARAPAGGAIDAAGATSQPCTSTPSLFHDKSFVSPTSARTSSSRRVRRSQSPTGPPHTFCAWAKDSRTTALRLPSRDSDSPTEPPALTRSGPFHSTVTPPCPVGSTEATADSPLTCAPNINLRGATHSSVVAVAFIPSVRLRALPPSNGTSITSPPLEPWSLISPSMTATCLPSGLHTGSASCHRGAYTTRARPLAVSSTCSFASHQLASPGG